MLEKVKSSRLDLRGTKSGGQSERADLENDDVHQVTVNAQQIHDYGRETVLHMIKARCDEDDMRRVMYVIPQC